MMLEMNGYDSGNESEENDEIARSAHAGMLHDHERHVKYNLALKETLKELEKTKNSIQILDIGTGTGILSMMAASHSENVKVVACEMFEPIAELAQKIIKDNGFKNQINVLNKSSTELTVPGDLSRKADVLVTEILDSELIGEGMIPTTNDAHHRLLSKDAKVIPASAKVCVQLVESETLWNMNSFDENVSGLEVPKQYKKCRRTANTHELQCSLLYPDHINLLSNSCQCAELDFTSFYRHNHGEKQSKHQTVVQIIKTGKLHGVLMWWNLVLHKEKNIVLSMAPSWDSTNYIWRDHWMQCLYFLPKSLDVVSGESVVVTMFHDNYSVWFDVSSVFHSPPTSLQSPICHCNLHISWSRQMFALWNTREIIENWKKLGLSFESKRILIVGDTSLAPLVLKKNGIENVAYSECSKWSKAIIKEISKTNDISILPANMNKEADVVLFDPFRSCNILPWQSLQIWENVYSLSQSDVSVFPLEMHLKVAVLQFQDLSTIRSPVGDIQGFDITRFDELIADAQRVYSHPDYGHFYSAEPYSIVEYEHLIASDLVTLMEFNLTHQTSQKDIFKPVTINLDREFTKEMALVAWLDFVYNDDITFTTGLKSKQSPEWVRYSKQAVVFIPDHLKSDLNGLSKFDCTVLYRPKHEHEILFSFSTGK